MPNPETHLKRVSFLPSSPNILDRCVPFIYYTLCLFGLVGRSIQPQNHCSPLISSISINYVTFAPLFRSIRSLCKAHKSTHSELRMDKIKRQKKHISFAYTHTTFVHFYYFIGYYHELFRLWFGLVFFSILKSLGVPWNIINYRLSINFYKYVNRILAINFGNFFCKYSIKRVKCL